MSDGVVLVGLPGSGKTSVGALLAERMGRAFVDIDESVVGETGRTPTQLIEEEGEPEFRDVERRAVERACAEHGAVIASGGGSVIDPLNRWAFTAHGTVVLLDVPIDRALERLREDDVTRPLLAGDPEGRLDELARERAPYYGSADLAVDGDGTPEEVADRILSVLGSRPTWRRLLDVQARRHHTIGPVEGRVVFGRDLDRASLDASMGDFEGRTPAVLVDRALSVRLPSLDRALPEGRRLEIVGGESVKRMAHLEEVLEWLAAQGVERGDPLICAGGGTIGDLGGVAAALYMRGIPLVHVPTTWVAMADSAIGGKAAVDLADTKNAVGAFWPAWAMIADVEALGVLPRDRLRDGMAECLKCGLIGDPDLWALVETRGLAALDGDDDAARYAILERAARLKLAIIDEDPYENGMRRVLNLGHTIGHALEVESRFGLAHGDAVALGLRAVTQIASRRGADPALAERLDTVLGELGFALTRRFDPALVKAAMRGDKKRDRGTLRWILPMGVGRIREVSDVTDSELDAALDLIQAA